MAAILITLASAALTAAGLTAISPVPTRVAIEALPYLVGLSKQARKGNRELTEQEMKTLSIAQKSLLEGWF